MRRRGFIGALAGMCAAPAVAMLPRATPATILELHASRSATEFAVARRLNDLARYEFAEFQAATLRIIAGGVAIPYEQLRADLESTTWRR